MYKMIGLDGEVVEEKQEGGKEWKSHSQIKSNKKDYD